MNLKNGNIFELTKLNGFLNIFYWFETNDLKNNYVLFYLVVVSVYIFC